jgi:flagellar hook-associated protein 1 FlgK
MFAGLNTALTALYAQRRGLDVTGQNIANANTEGYTRQRVDLRAVGGPITPAIYATTDGTGEGVDVANVERLRDTFLESRGRAEHAQSAYLDAQNTVHSSLELVFKEPSDTGLQSQLSDLWSAAHDLANRPGDAAARTQLLQRGTQVASTLNSFHDTLGSLWSSTREQLDAVTTDVNTTASTVARLNQAIVNARSAGLASNELEDQRDLLVMHVSELTGATALPRKDGAVDLMVGGSSLVSGPNARKLTVTGAARFIDQATSPVSLEWVDTKTPASASGGQVASVLETLGTTIPKYSTAIDRVAASLISTVNTQHKAGFDLAGNRGGDFFSGYDAGTIGVAISDPSLLAAAGSAGGSLDGSNADALATAGTAVGGADRTYRQLVVDLGVATQTINRRSAIQSTTVQDVDAARAAQSGVNLDEEMTNMIMFQRAYEAAARVMTTVDGMLDTLINRTGLVGR